MNDVVVIKWDSRARVALQRGCGSDHPIETAEWRRVQLAPRGRVECAAPWRSETGLAQRQGRCNGLWEQSPWNGLWEQSPPPAAVLK
eukprot:CAMPEP_0181242604 /NCGR_PEP_ID=MMETSP1096-20121128/41784_1 /TAXON_ID=156174 ORGANISM="Chrysochromulina ericina, Strain CCMP281" /NCGR_SAMPLE_ID=MMETSP1096 /ASSEMBLY_ACC=CAM_ASM_000453 /LENGTH=86 /DNA_ID=CAMNT_0023338835 /DNA_START=302 /DNA_END=562 /DNA_ORIENTATION=+